MKLVIIVVVIGFAAYSFANLISGKVEGFNVAPLTAAIFASIGSYIALSMAHSGR